MRVYSPEQAAEHAKKLAEYFAQCSHREVAMTILKEELEKADGDFDIAIERAMMRQR